MANPQYDDICQIDNKLPIHQLNKLDEEGDKRNPIYPISLVQAIFDKSGLRLDTILSWFNYLYLPYKGSKAETRLQVPADWRRRSLVITYRDMDNKTIIEIYNSDDRGDQYWKDDTNWIDFETYIKDFIEEVVKDVFNHIEDYPVITDFIKEVIDEWLGENAYDRIDSVVNNYLNKIDVSQQVSDKVNEWFENNQTEFDELINNNIQSWMDSNIKNIVDQSVADYMEGQDISTLVQTAVNNYIANNPEVINEIIEQYVNKNLETNLEPIAGEFFNAIVSYIGQNERVIANALARHEQAITNLQNG